MKKITNKYLVAFFIVFMTILSLVLFSIGCTKKESSKKPAQQLKVGIVTWIGFGPLFVAEQKGYFKEKGLDVKISIIEDEAARRSAFVSGQLDIAANTIDALASGAPRGVDGVIFLKADDSFGADGIVAKKDITSISRLKGKKVAYPKGLPSHYFLYEELKNNNMSIKDITSIYMEASDAAAAFAAGKVDAAVTWEPWLSQSATTGNILATTKDKPGLIVDILMVNPKSLKEKSEAIKIFLKEWFKGLEYLQNNPQESIKIIAEGLKLSIQDTTALMSLVKFSDLTENKRFFGIEGDKNFCIDNFSKASNLWYEEKIIEKKADPKLHCDGTIVMTLMQ